MSAPKTDLEKQEKQHKVPLVGMAWAIIWAVVLLVALVVYLTMTGNEPDDGQTVTGDQVETPSAQSADEGQATDQESQ